MAGFIPAVRMGVRRFAALVTPGDHFFADTFTQPVVKYEIFSPELIGKSFFFYSIRVIDDAVKAAWMFTGFLKKNGRFFVKESRTA